MAARKTRKQQEEKPPRTGMLAAQQQMAGGGSRFPILKLGDGDRARFHFLTDGNTDLIGTKFHRFGEDRETRYYMCLRVFTGGDEECKWCQEGHDELGSRFAMWVYVHNILHAKQEDDDWGPTQIGKKTLFKEVVKEPKLIRLAGGRKGAWFNQFVNMWTTHGDLQLHIYELYREGEGRDDTNYTLTTLKEQAIDPKLLDSEEIKDLLSCEDVLREEIQFGPGSAGSGASMGTDAVLGGNNQGETEETTAVLAKEPEAAAEETPSEPAADDDLI